MITKVGRKMGFSLADYAKQHHKNIGSFRLKDGSSVKLIGCQESDMIEMYKIKNNKFYGGSVFKGENSVPRAAEEFCAVAEKQAVNENEAVLAWEAVCRYYNPNLR